MPDGMGRPLLAACMACGEQRRVEPDADLGAKPGWQFNDWHGWLCSRCSRLDLRPARRSAGRPTKR